jgi:hypothetical protein
MGRAELSRSSGSPAGDPELRCSQSAPVAPKSHPPRIRRPRPPRRSAQPAMRAEPRRRRRRSGPRGHGPPSGRAQQGGLQTASAPVPARGNAHPSQAKPARIRYQPGAPTGSAGVPSNPTATLVTVRRPRATQLPGGSAVTDGCRRLAEKLTVIARARGHKAESRRPTSEHHGLMPVRMKRPSCSAAARGASAAKTPQVPAGAATPASARIASASLCVASFHAPLTT